MTIMTKPAYIREQGHTPGPLRAQKPRGPQHAIDRKWEIVQPCDGGGEHVIVGEHTGVDCLMEANAMRLVACVNACEGIPTPMLGEAGAVVPAITFQRAQEAISTLRRENEALRAACEAALKPIDFDCSNFAQMALRAQLRAALGGKP